MPMATIQQVVIVPRATGSDMPRATIQQVARVLIGSSTAMRVPRATKLQAASHQITSRECLNNAPGSCQHQLAARLAAWP